MSNLISSRLLTLIAVSLIASGCQSPPRQEQANLGDLFKAQAKEAAQTQASYETVKTKDPVVADNNAGDMPGTDTRKAQRSISQLEIYKNALASLDDAEVSPELANNLQSKIIALEIQEADKRYADAPDQPQVYSPVISRLQDWIKTNPSHELTAGYQYQLARLLDITGQSQDAEETLANLKSTQQHLPGRQKEVEFRLAESAFSKREYEKAVEHYSAVLASEQASGGQFEHYYKALYMRAWSYLQLNEFKKSAEDFTILLTDKAFSTENKQMIDDSYRGLILAINDAGGINELPNLVSLQVLQPIATKLYDKVIAFYTEEERWTDVINTYQAFQQHYPATEEAVEMAIALLAFLEEKEQKASLREEKADFVLRYTQLAPQKSAEFTLELAQYYRFQALNSDETFEQSLSYYEFFLNNFEAYPEYDKVKFSYAETLLEAGNISAARTLLAELSSGKTSPSIREKASYLAITSLNDQIQQQGKNTAEIESLNEEKFVLARAFIKDYPSHPKASQVLQWLMVESYKKQDFEQSIALAQQAMQAYPDLAAEASQIKADSLFSLEKWNEAALAYENLIRSQRTHKDVSTWKTNALVSYYRAAREAGKTQEALQLYAKVYDSNNTQSELVPAALYEAAILASTFEDKALQNTSIDLLNRYIVKYKAGENRRDAQIKLAELYVQNENWLAAAPLLQEVAGQMQDPNLKRAAILEVADLYRKAGSTQKAINAYESFLGNAPQSGDASYQEISEARQALIELYEINGEKSKAYTAMQSYIDNDLNAAQATKKSREATLKYGTLLAQRQEQQYRQIPLTGNLQTSFQRKQQALEKAITAYKQLERIGTPEAEQIVNVGIGNIFAHLSEALLNAPVPAELSALEQEEYMLIVEEQAFPFEEKALESHLKNVEMLHKGHWSEGIISSLNSLRRLMPARFDKQEQFEGAIIHVE